MPSARVARILRATEIRGSAQPPARILDSVQPGIGDVANQGEDGLPSLTEMKGEPAPGEGIVWKPVGGLLRHRHCPSAASRAPPWALATAYRFGRRESRRAWRPRKRCCGRDRGPWPLRRG